MMSLHEGFGLVALLVVIAIVLLVFGGGFYIKNIKTQQTQVEQGKVAERQAEDVKLKVESQNSLLEHN